MLPLIDEWKPSSPSKTPFSFAVLAITLALIAWKRPRLPSVRWVLLGALLGLALLQVRHQAIVAIAAAMMLPQGFARSGGREHVADRQLGWIAAADASRQRSQSVEAYRRSPAGAAIPARPQRLFDGRAADPRGHPPVY
jgi:hypothetical protein